MPRTRALILLALSASVLASCTQASTEEPPPPVLPQVEAPSPLPPFDPNGDAIVQVVERVRPAVVNVVAELAGGQRGEGTGFIVRRDGIVVTNFHVVEGAGALTVITEDGQRYRARGIGGLDSADLAVLKIQADDLPTVPLGDSSELDLGQPVVAMGFALGLEGGPSVTSGIVSALNRTIEAGGEAAASRTYEGVIQTDAAINPGNSGGPLVNLSGEVVGINTAGVQAGQAENIGFAIAINRARPVIEHAIAEPQAPVPYLGVSTEDVTPEVAALEGLSVDRGAIVRAVEPETPADGAGIQAGDIIVGIAGEPVESSQGVLERLLEHDPGDTVSVTVVRGEVTVDLSVTLGTRAAPIG
jgi:S1-C subfamily serine protease